MSIKTAKELAIAVEKVAKNNKTLYVMGCFGAPMTDANKQRYINHHSYNRSVTRKRMINAATPDTFGFDCVCLIKALLWGWNGNKNAIYGGAAYGSNNVPDIDADAMIKVCKDVSTNFSNVQVGEALWMKGHIGIYIGNGLAVECSPKWANGVQITAVGNIGKKAGYKTRTWTKHGKLPYVSYAAPVVDKKPTEVTATEYAKSFDKSLAGTYVVTANSGLNIRHGAGVTKKKMVTIPKGTKVECFGYYTAVLGVKWLTIQFTYNGVKYTGFASSNYLKK